MATQVTPAGVPDDEALAEYLAAKQELQAQAQGDRPAVVTKTDAGPDLETEAEYRRELRELKRIEAANLKAQAEYATGKRKTLPPIAAAARFFMSDPTIPRDENGQDIRERGWMYSWVPLADSHTDLEKHSSAAIFLRQSEGFEVVKDANGKRRECHLGVLMRIRPRQAALREVARAPAGAVAAEDYFAANVEEFAQDLNRAAGTPLLRTWREDSHGHYQSSNPEG